MWFVENHETGAVPMEVTTIGLDLAKHVFQVHGVDASGAIALRRRVRRSEMVRFFGRLDRCLIGMEACATAHHWARTLRALGHEVRLMPPHYVKAYVKRNKNDAADAEAICEAVTRPSMRFVPVKSVEQQGTLMLHRSRELLIRQRTMLINALRGHLAEYGIIAAKGPSNAAQLVALLGEPADDALPASALVALRAIAAQLATADEQIAALHGEIVAWHRGSAASRRLAGVPGIGPVIASAAVATVADPSAFTSGRHFAAWLGLVPKQNGTGGRQSLGRISKRGDSYLRRLLINGAQSVLRWAKKGKSSPWLIALLARRPRSVVAIALANKMARIVWAMLRRGEDYRNEATASAA
jgi:transposase